MLRRGHLRLRSLLPGLLPAIQRKHRTPWRDVHPGTGFFLRLCGEGPTVPAEELGACERLVPEIPAFIRRSFPRGVCRLFLLRYYESPRPCSYRLLAQYAGMTPSRAAREVKAVVQAVRANRCFARRSRRLAASEAPYTGYAG